MDLGRLFLAPLVGIGEVARRLGPDEDGQPILPQILGLDHRRPGG